jgi:hypothetical protein
MSSVEHMAGRLLSKMQSISLEMVTEMKEARHALTALIDAVMILNHRLDVVEGNDNNKQE